MKYFACFVRTDTIGEMPKFEDGTFEVQPAQDVVLQIKERIYDRLTKEGKIANTLALVSYQRRG